MAEEQGPVTTGGDAEDLVDRLVRMERLRNLVATLVLCEQVDGGNYEWMPLEGDSAWIDEAVKQLIVDEIERLKTEVKAHMGARR